MLAPAGAAVAREGVDCPEELLRGPDQAPSIRPQAMMQMRPDRRANWIIIRAIKLQLQFRLGQSLPKRDIHVASVYPSVCSGLRETK